MQLLFLPTHTICFFLSPLEYFKRLTSLGYGKVLTPFASALAKHSRTDVSDSEPRGDFYARIFSYAYVNSTYMHEACWQFWLPTKLVRRSGRACTSAQWRSLQRCTLGKLICGHDDEQTKPRRSIIGVKYRLPKSYVGVLRHMMACQSGWWALNVLGRGSLPGED
ncbi:hypothetical protein K458DRAFT_101644 [Lentithecium fluviatile CBS 122367]|uniref:Uncharacterized protein n=1 Tax=Lentithecium fluviatile CBS 122367 TaxID=1168545 RepID=A0A6G1JIJ9_9PLEO|nr:hypothetical protein K458DRAFT_101644 [Lentithecium fluviatile CBS 122367]